VALHANIAGFDLATFRSLVEGPVEPRRAEAILQDVARRLRGAEEHEVRSVLNRVRHILDGRIRPGTLTEEDHTLVHAVIALATTGQRPRWTDADVRPAAFIDFADRFPVAPSDLNGGAAPGPWMGTLVRWALVQRPVFGHQQSDWWSSYGYLSHAEAGRLLAYHRTHPSLGSHEPAFSARFFGWVSEIHDAGLDYWFHSSMRSSPRPQPSQPARDTTDPGRSDVESRPVPRVRYVRGVARAWPM
jgi:hypothetical protein